MASRKSRTNSSARPCISGTGLLLELRNFIAAHPPLELLFEQNPCWARVIAFVESLERQRAVMEALTMVHIRSQMDFERAAFCAWMSLLVAMRLKLALAHQRALFYAGLLQDIGKHLPVPEPRSLPTPKLVLIGFDGDATDTHPLRASIQLEANLPDVDGLSELVLYHHARDDGTGYPRQITEAQLPLDCQILILANELSDRLDRLGGHNKLPQVLPGLRLGGLLYFERAHQGWLELLQPLASELELTTGERYAHIIGRRRETLRQLLTSLLTLSAELLPLDHDFKVHTARAAIHKLTRILIDSGVINESIDGELGGLPMQVKSEIELVLRGVVDFIVPCQRSLHRLIESRRLAVDPVSARAAQRLLDRSLAELSQPASAAGLFRF
jgi:hypothetical protein